jgi:hypothetical protein
MIINNKTNIIPDIIEKYIIKLINKNPPNSYNIMKTNEIDSIQNKVQSKYNFTIDPKIIVSIKSSYMKDYIINNYKNIYKYAHKIQHDYNNTNILLLSKKYDLSPVTIINFIFEKKYKNKLSNIVKNISILNHYDKKQLYIATSNDIYYQLDQTSNAVNAEDFEKKIEEFLINNKIKYMTQEQLTQEQMKQYGKAINTPDFLIKSELIINGQKINWIDAKNFYGSNIGFIKKKINKQIIKYITEYGSGCIIFSLGYNDKLIFDNTLCLSYDSIIVK